MNFFNFPAVGQLLDSAAKPADDIVLSLANKLAAKNSRGDAVSVAIGELSTMGQGAPEWMEHSCSRLISQIAPKALRTEHVAISLLVRFIAGVYKCRHERILLTPLQQNLVLSLAGKFVA